MPYIKPTLFNPPEPSKNDVWCPFCDWHMADTLTGRKRMGLHIANHHTKEVVFEKGTEPRDLESAGKK